MVFRLGKSYSRFHLYMVLTTSDAMMEYISKVHLYLNFYNLLGMVNYMAILAMVILE